MADPLPALMTIFEAALARGEGADRAAYLDQVCANQPAVRLQVEQMLAAQPLLGQFLEPPVEPVDCTSALPPADATRTPVPDGSVSSAGWHEPPLLAERGTVIAGRYILAEVIGEGGMGTVYRAEQSEPVKRSVALKLIKSGMDSRAVSARFEAERQALALMDHPNIARIYDGGVTDCGQPFFVMELVDGVPLHDYCDTHRLSVDARLQLFVAVCQAVQHAHQKGIIHRDLKPANVLVTVVDGQPTPKVIDFGVAKATEQRLTDQSLENIGAIVGTPAYMSPEQADPTTADIDTRTDVYALGVILYELLTGSPPIDAKQFHRGAILEMLRMVREVDPLKPSTKVSTSDAMPSIAATRGVEPAQLKRALYGDLDWIVMRALEKDRTRRYETANGLAADILRHLAHEPVLAAPPSRMYRMRKFARRHQQLLLTATAFATLLLLGATVSIWQAVEATLAKNRTRAALDDLKIEQQRTMDALAAKSAALAAETTARTQTLRALNTMTDDVIGDLFAKQDQLDDRQREFLRKVMAFHQEFAAEPGDSEESRAVAADGQNRVAVLQDLLGERAAAIDSFLETIRRRESLVKDFTATSEHRYRLAQSHLNLGVAYMGRDEHQKADAAYTRALKLFDELAAEFPEVPKYREGQAQCHSNLGILRTRLGKYGDAEVAYRQSLDLKARLVADLPSVPGLRESLARGQINFGHFLRDIGAGPKAADAYGQARETLEELAREFPEAHQCQCELGVVCQSLAALLSDMNRLPEAEAVCVRGLKVLEKLAADLPAVPKYRHELANCHRILGVVLQRQRRPREAQAAYNRALALGERLVAEFPSIADHRHGLSSTLNDLAILLTDERQYPEAEAASRRALALDERLVADFPEVPSFRTGLAGNCVNFGNLLRALNRSRDSLEWYDKAIPLLDAGLANDARRELDREFLRNAHLGRALALTNLQRHAEAVADWDQAAALAGEPQRSILRLEKALALTRAGDHVQATAEVDAVTRGETTIGAVLYGGARAYGAVLASEKIDAEVREKYAAQAFALLRRARDIGYFQSAGTLSTLGVEPYLEPLRQRPEFPKFLAELKQ